MDSFELAEELSGLNEGGIANHPKDPGGLTYKGIAYNFHPHWSGWQIVKPKFEAWIKASRSYKYINTQFEKDEFLQHLVLQFYRKTYWEPLMLDRVPQVISNEVYDTAKNCGKSNAVTFLQRSVNLTTDLKRRILVDGLMGEITLRAVISCPSTTMLYNLLNIYQGEYYLKLVEDNPKRYRTFLKSWLRRVEIRQSY